MRVTAEGPLGHVLLYPGDSAAVSVLCVCVCVCQKDEISIKKIIIQMPTVCS